jgi:hypothetical protein
VRAADACGLARRRSARDDALQRVVHPIRGRNADKEKTFCTGTYAEKDGTVTFTWISGCFGDWSGSYAIDGDTVTWSDVKALPPHDSKEEQRQAEVFAVPWTRTADAPGS